MLTDKFSERSKMRRLATTDKSYDWVETGLELVDKKYQQLLTETQEAKFNG